MLCFALLCWARHGMLAVMLAGMLGMLAGMLAGMLVGMLVACWGHARGMLGAC